LIKSSLS